MYLGVEESQNAVEDSENIASGNPLKQHPEHQLSNSMLELATGLQLTLTRLRVCHVANAQFIFGSQVAGSCSRSLRDRCLIAGKGA